MMRGENDGDDGECDDDDETVYTADVQLDFSANIKSFPPCTQQTMPTISTQHQRAVQIVRIHVV